MCRLTGVAIFFGLILSCRTASGELLSYHSNTVNGSWTTYSATNYMPIVLYDLPDPAKSYNVTSLSIMSSGRDAVFPQGSGIKLWILDLAGAAIYTSSVFDVSGQSAALAWRTFYTNDDSFTVSGSFYAGFQDMASLTFGYKTDIPAGLDYDRSFTYKVNTATIRRPSDEDFMIDVNVEESSTPGDTDGNGTVDYLDYGNLLAQIGGPPDAERGADFNNDDKVDLKDFTIMRTNFDSGIASALDIGSAVTVPEPAALTLLALGSGLLLRRRRRRACLP